MIYKVTVSVETDDGIVVSHTDTLSPNNLSYLLGVITLNFALPISRQLREKAIEPQRFEAGRKTV